MSVSMYQLSVPVYIRILNGLAGLMRKAAAHCAEKKLDEAALLDYRLYPDMFTLTKQVQIAADHAKGGAARLAGEESPKYEDNETSFSALAARVDKTVAYLETLKPAQIDGSEEKTIVLKMRSGELSLPGLKFVLHHSMPNFYFHVTTAYAILRHNGVEVGKRDFLGPN
jgi:uncharacterized protein